MKKKIYVICFIMLLLGVAIGYSIGYVAALNWGVEKFIVFAERQGIKIELNPAMIAAGLYQYKNQIGGCLFTQNASIRNDTGN